MKNEKKPEVGTFLPTWHEVTAAFDVFANDYAIVGHPLTPHTSVFGKPNGIAENGERQYSVSQLAGITQEVFDGRMSSIRTVFVGCMDKDAIGPIHAQLPSDTLTLSMAGGIVQPAGDRATALATILKYVAARGIALETVILSGHNYGCGLVKVATNGKPLPENLGTEPASEVENTAMKSLIRHGALQVGAHDLFANIQVQLALVAIDRDGTAEFDMDFESIDAIGLDVIFG